jgi:hypothetical protein
MEHEILPIQCFLMFEQLLFNMNSEHYLGEQYTDI